ncbi:MAG: arginine repressor [Lachnospiraceae bacterium]|nr:arginine repressor [Lachnospiraceae bacterium]
MKVERHSKIVELIGKYEIETQEELAEYLNRAGFNVTQATVSRDIRELKLTKAATEGGKQKYMVLQSQTGFSDKYIRILQDGYLSMDMAQNILVLKTVAGMAMAVAAALDAMHFHEIVGCIAGDDTIMCAVRSVDDTILVMDKIRKLVQGSHGNLSYHYEDT